LLVVLAPLGAAHGQQALGQTLAAASRLHREPDGVELASLSSGAAVAPGRSAGRWVEVQVEGWVRSRAVGAANRDGYDLVVTAGGGERILRTAGGAPIGRLRSGTLLKKLETNGAWTRVRRQGWVLRTALAAPESGSPPAAADSTRAEIGRAAALHTAPDGGLLATLQPGTAARVLGRSGDWIHVQVDGWVREGDLKTAPGGALLGVSAADVRANPERYVGQTVEWRLQLISIQTADELRPEIPRGEPYLLTRGPLPEPGFVYVIVPRDLVPRFKSLGPLAEITVRATIHAARSRYLATPVLQLQALAEPTGATP
jgi:hypothetical protein